MNDSRRNDRNKESFEQMTFEEKTYEYARRWARWTRRDFMKVGAAAAGGFALASTGPWGRGVPPAYAQKSGGHIRIARGQESDTLDPQKTSLLVAHEISWQIYDSLIYLDETGKVYPGSAESWSFSNNNKTVTFKLKPGLKFHDGTPFNAQAIEFTVNRHLAPETASPTAWILGPIDGVEVIDDLTVAYHYKDPFIALWVGLGYSYAAPISPAAVEKYGDLFGRNPVGTGPFRFVKWEPDKGITLERNPEHDWATPWYKNQGLPYLDSAEYVVIPEDATRIAALSAGEIDVISGTDAVPIDKIRRLKKTKGVKVYTRPAVGLYYSYINTKIEPLNDVRVRKAMNFATDKEKLIALVLDGNGQPAYSPVASAFAQFDPSVKKIGYDYDLERAKQLMKEAGQEAGFSIDYLVIESPVYRRIAEVVQEDLEKINIKINIRSYPVAELFAMAPKGEAGLTFFYYTYSDPDLIYALLKEGEVMSWSFQKDPELDRMLEEQRVEFDFEKRQKILHAIQQKVVDDALWLFLYEGVYVAAMREQVQGLTLDTVGFHHLQDIWLA